MPRPAVGGPQQFVTGSELLKAMSTVQTAIRTATLTAREMRTKTMTFKQDKERLESSEAIHYTTVSVCLSLYEHEEFDPLHRSKIHRHTKLGPKRIF